MSGIYLVAAEPSGDAFAAEIVDALRVRNGETAIHGVGGSELASRGIESPIDIAPLSIVGLLDGLKVYRQVIALADATVDDIIAHDPDQVLLVDSWGFMIRVAERLRARRPDIRIVKVIGPQVWATRPGRAAKLARVVDAVLCIHDFEPPFYEGLDVDTAVIGNPAFGRDISGDADAYRASRGLDAGKPLVTVLPGSRSSEMRRVAPALIEAAALLRDARPDLALAIAPSASVASLLDLGRLEGAANIDLITAEKRRHDAIAASDLVLACSGTVTTEVAMLGAPVIVAYKLGWVTWAIARSFLYKPKYITLMNIAAGNEIAPEFVQTRCKAELIAEAASALLATPERRLRQVAGQNAALQLMGIGGEPASARVADYVLGARSTQRQQPG